MMYHFMLGLRGASPPGAAFSPPLDPASFFSSSCIDCSVLVCCNTSVPSPDSGDRRLVFKSVVSEITEHRVNGMADHQVHRPEIRRKQENCDNHHDRGCLHFLERGRRDLLHLGTHVVVESLDPLGPGLDAIAEIVTGSCE